MHESNEADHQMTRAEVKRQLNHFAPATSPGHTIDDSIFLEIENALRSHADFHEWRRRPRLYRLLRMLRLDQDHPIFNSFVREQLDDVSLPFREKYLPMALRDEEELLEEFLKFQPLVCTQTELMNASNFTRHLQTHRHITDGNAHFEELENLGKGGSASVERVRHRLSGICFARKAISRGDHMEHQREKLGEFQREMKALKRLNHKHLISYVGSYTDLKYFALILSPVADMELKTLLYRRNDGPLESEEINWLRDAFGCIANAVAYCHEQKIRHKDVKPGNILLSNGRIYLCDFGIAHDWSDSDHATTIGDPGKYTKRYSAPEVIDSRARNQSSDIWSMGCVFLEMLSVIKGHTMQKLETHLIPNGGVVEYWRVQEAAADWIVKLRDDTPEDIALEWVEKMTNENPAARPTASDISADIQAQYHTTASRIWFIGTCCVSQSQSSVSSGTSPTSRSDSSIGPTDISHLGHDTVPSHHTNTVFRPTFSERPSSIEPHTESPLSLLGRHRSLQVPSAGYRRSSTLSSSTSSKPSVAASEPVSGNGNEPLGDRQGSLPTNLRNDVDCPSLSNLTIFNGRSTIDSRVYPGIPQNGLGISSGELDASPSRAKFTGSSLHCLCGPRHNERQTFEAPLASAWTQHGLEFAERSERCQGGFKSIRIYERQSKEVWETTRRIVFSMQENGSEAACTSFWLPLANICTQIHTDILTLWWSDCNQIKGRSMGNWGDVYDWVYDPSNPNHHLKIQIPVVQLEKLVGCLHLPSNDTNRLPREQIHRIHTSLDQTADLYSVCAKSSRTGHLERLYRMLVLANTNKQVVYSTVYSMGPDLDFEMKLLDDEIDRRSRQRAYRFQIKITNVSSPMYRSDLQELPAPDFKKKAKCQSIEDVPSIAELDFAIGATHKFPSPPPDVVSLLSCLTTWTLTFFAVVSRFRSPRKRFGTKDYGAGDLTLWERNNSDRTGRVCQLAFRVYPNADRDPASEKLWTTGSVRRNSNFSTSDRADATIGIGNKVHGHLLDIRHMTASDPRTKTSEPEYHRISHARNETTDMTITFGDPNCQREFYKLIKSFQEIAATNSSEIRRSAAPTSPRNTRLNSMRSSGSDLGPTMGKTTFSPSFRSSP